MRVVVLLCFLLACGRRTPLERTFETLAALDDQTAIVTGRQGDEYFVGRLDANGQLLWSTPLEGRPQHAPFRSPALFLEDVVVVRTFRRNKNAASIAFEAFTTENGRRRWSSSLRTVEGQADITAAMNPLFLGYADSVGLHGYLEPIHGHARELITVAAADGKLTDRKNVEIGAAHAPIEVGGTVFLHGARELSLDLSAPLEPFESRGAGCVVDQTYQRLRGLDGHWQLEGRDGSRIQLPYTTTVPVFLVGCARYRDRTVVFVELAQGGELLVFDPDRTLSERLAMKRPVTEVRDIAPSATFASGVLPRFVPLLVQDAKGRELLMIDLDRAETIWSVATDARDRVLRMGETWVWAWLDDGSHIAELDGENGKLRAALRVDAPLAPLDPRHVRGSRLWLLSPAPAADGDVPVVRLETELRATRNTLGLRDDGDNPHLAPIPR